jgi:type II secretory ATPase GspE/PulE/Tfp pilus assembly ATPase PilB-like protein
MERDNETAAPVQFTAAGDTAEERQENEEMVSTSPGYNPAANIIAEAIHKDADLTILDFTAQQVNVRFRIDGLWHPGQPMDRQTGDYMLAVVKQLAGMDYRDRRNKQTGKFATEYQRKKQSFKIVAQGTPTGERVGLYLSYKRPPLDKLEDLGIRKSMIPNIVQLMDMTEKAGMFLVSAVPGEGYTAAWRGALDSCDRLVRDFFVLEDVTQQEPEVINVMPETFDSRKGETAMTPLPQLLLREPDVLAVPNLTDGKLIDQLVDVSNDNSIPVYLRNEGKNAIDALLRILALNPKRKELLALLSGVLCMRLVRKLCENCKVGYQPHPQLLQKLGLPQGRIEKLYRPFIWKPGLVDEEENEIQPCTTCCGVGYKGRTGIFELLTMNDDLRASASQNPNFNTLMNIAKINGHITIQQEAAVVIAQGITSVEELQRMLQA